VVAPSPELLAVLPEKDRLQYLARCQRHAGLLESHRDTLRANDQSQRLAMDANNQSRRLTNAQIESLWGNLLADSSHSNTMSPKQLSQPETNH
jgi:hypothetical protein